MSITLPYKLRVGLYLLTVVGTPVVVWAKAHGWITDLDLTLWGAEVTAVTGVAALHATDNSAESE